MAKTTASWSSGSTDSILQRVNELTEQSGTLNKLFYIYFEKATHHSYKRNSSTETFQDAMKRPGPVTYAGGDVPIHVELIGTQESGLFFSECKIKVLQGKCLVTKISGAETYSVLKDIFNCDISASPRLDVLEAAAHGVRGLDEKCVENLKELNVLNSSAWPNLTIEQVNLSAGQEATIEAGYYFISFMF